ncbi:MAG: DUF4381 domain-containing protein [Pseudomonadota bacterium]
MSDPLEALRDIHLPDAISWWPLAWGYWVVMLLLLATGWFMWRRYRQYAVHRAAMKTLRELDRRYQSHGDSHRLAREINVLLKRTLLTLQPRTQVAKLAGDAWLDRLQSTGSGFSFSDAMREVLARDIYRQTAQLDACELVNECRRWIRALPRVKG